MEINKELMMFLDQSTSVFHVIQNSAELLNKKGYKRFVMDSKWNLEKDKKGYVTFNDSTIVAFNVGEVPSGFNIVASHSDSPNFKVKPHAIKQSGPYVQLNTETYGGLIHHTWLDRPLALAGRVLIETDTGIESHLYDSKKAVAVIPSLAIHMHREVNQGAKFNPQKHLVPLMGLSENFSFEAMLLEGVGIEDANVLDYELNVYPIERSSFIGINNDFIMANRIDNLQSAFTSLKAFIDADVADAINICVIFDNEEVGSMTKQGAQSTVMKDVMQKIMMSLGYSAEDYHAFLQHSFMVSADNAHATHPNYQEKNDENHPIIINQGPVIKYNAAQNYTTDGVSGALFKKLAKDVKENVQLFVNRSDVRGGGTLGSISATQVSIKSVDIGLPQLAMHSAMELTGSQDTKSLYNILKHFYSVSFKISDNKIEIK